MTMKDREKCKKGIVVAIDATRTLERQSIPLSLWELRNPTDVRFFPLPEGIIKSRERTAPALSQLDYERKREREKEPCAGGDREPTDGLAYDSLIALVPLICPASSVSFSFSLSLSFARYRTHTYARFSVPRVHTHYTHITLVDSRALY